MADLRKILGIRMVGSGWRGLKLMGDYEVCVKPALPICAKGLRNAKISAIFRAHLETFQMAGMGYLKRQARQFPGTSLWKGLTWHSHLTSHW